MTKTVSAEWRVRRLGDVAKVIPGFAFKSKDWCKEGVPVIKIKNIVGDLTVDTVEADCVPHDLLTEKLRKFVLDDGDILVAMTGATAGKVGRLRCKRPHLLNQRVAKLVPFDVDPFYFWAVVSSDEYQGRFFKLADGAAQPNMSGGQIESVELLVPSRNTQRKIAGVLSAYDDLIENNTRRIAILEEMAQAIYREWFVNFRFPGHEKVKLINSPLGKIPEGWAATVADFGKVITGKTPTKTRPENFGGDIPFVKTPDMHGNLFCISTGETLSESGMASQPSQTVPPNSVCISCIGTVGAISITTTTCQTNQQINTIIPNSPCWREFIVLCLRDSVARLKQMGAAGATMDNISKGKLMAFDVLLPPSNILEAFSSVTSELFDRIRLLQRQTNVLRATRDLLLPKLICGQLDVEELDIETGKPLVEAEAE